MINILFARICLRSGVIPTWQSALFFYSKSTHQRYSAHQHRGYRVVLFYPIQIQTTHAEMVMHGHYIRTFSFSLIPFSSLECIHMLKYDTYEEERVEWQWRHCRWFASDKCHSSRGFKKTSVTKLEMSWPVLQHFEDILCIIYYTAPEGVWDLRLI